MNVPITAFCASSRRVLLNQSQRSKTGVVAIETQHGGCNGVGHIFKFPAVIAPCHIDGGGDVGAGQRCELVGKGFAVFGLGDITAVKHDIAIFGNVFTDGCPGGGISLQGLHINNTVVQHQITVAAVADNVDGIVFDSGTVKIFIDLIENVHTFFKDKDFGTFGKVVDNDFRVLHTAADDDQFMTGPFSDSSCHLFGGHDDFFFAVSFGFGSGFKIGAALFSFCFNINGDHFGGIFADHAVSIIFKHISAFFNLNAFIGGNGFNGSRDL